MNSIQQVLGARPAANITWYNNSIPLQNDQNTGTEIKERSVNMAPATISLSFSRFLCLYPVCQDLSGDETYSTFSMLSFVATRFENGVTFRCDADNVVMRDDSDNPLHDSLLLQVMCK